MMRVVIQSSLMVIWLASVATTAVVLWFPVEVVEVRALEFARQDQDSQFQAAGTARALWWFLRVAAPLVLVSASIGLCRLQKVTRFAETLWCGLVAATSVSAMCLPETRHPWCARAASSMFRLCLAAWFLLAVYHTGASVWQRLKDWPVYRLQAGKDLLPNISPANRDVIRYVGQATPPGARILALSDQKLFFLAYYLLPRRIYHHLHPEAIFVIPKPTGERQLKAYRLEDLDREWIAKLKPDFILEYFEGQTYIDPARLQADQRWISFQRSRRGPDYRPTYEVRLRPYAAVVSP